MEEALPQLNDLYCYFAQVGSWKELSPLDIIQRKRKLDRLFYANRSFFSAAALTRYEAFSGSLFKTYAAPGADARLRTGLTSHDGSRQGSYPGAWQPEWTAMFADDDDCTSRETIRDRYNALIDFLGTEVGADPRGGGGAR